MANHLSLKTLTLAIFATFMLSACGGDDDYAPAAEASDSPAVDSMANAEPGMEFLSEDDSE